MEAPSAPSTDLVVPGSGELVDLTNEIACCAALRTVQDMEAQLREAKRTLARAIADRARVLGTKTIVLPGGGRAQVGADHETIYDAEAIEDGLRAAGMPEERIKDIIEVTVSTRVRAAEAKRAAAANPDYARVIETNRREIEKSPSVSFRR